MLTPFSAVLFFLAGFASAVTVITHVNRERRTRNVFALFTACYCIGAVILQVIK